MIGKIKSKSIQRSLLLLVFLGELLSLREVASSFEEQFESGILVLANGEGEVVSGGNKSRIEQLERRLSQLQEELVSLRDSSCCHHHKQSGRNQPGHCHRRRRRRHRKEAPKRTKRLSHSRKIAGWSKNGLEAPPEAAVGEQQGEEYGGEGGSLESFRRRRASLSRLTRALAAGAEVESRSQASFFRGERGEPGRNGLDGVPGLDGAPGLDGIPGLDGRNGKDGANGRDGRDGKDGQPGERGPPGPVGVPGEPGKRGKQGPQGKPGPPGPAGVCAYRAKYDCNLLGPTTTKLSSNLNATSELLLMPPTMLGGGPLPEVAGESGETAATSGRQVTVTEGDNIQLSCEAAGQPQPSYSWRRFDQATILLEVASDFRVTSYAGSQLPLGPVDRLQAGSYECQASNGVPPDASKRINLDVNYKPTIRLYSPSFNYDDHPGRLKARLGSTILLECLVEANPAPFTYWTFAPLATTTTRALTENRKSPPEAKVSLVSESTGQLINGASYSIVSFNITSLERHHFGQYKCLSKNLVGQTQASFWLESAEVEELQPEGVNKNNKTDKWNLERLHYGLGWPSHLIERQASYATFGNEHRNFRQIDKIDRRPAGSRQLFVPVTPSLSSSNDSMTTTKQKISLSAGDSTSGIGDSSYPSSSSDSIAEGELCRLERLGRPTGETIERSRKLVMLLDQIGKPVYLAGSSTSASASASASGQQLDWWSLEARPAPSGQKEAEMYYLATSAASPQTLLAFTSLAELAAAAAGSGQLELSGGSLTFKLNYRKFANSQVVYNNQFIYIAHPINSIATQSEQFHEQQTLKSLMIVSLNLTSNQESVVKFDSILPENLLNQPLDLTGKSSDNDQYQLNRLELLVDENGLWLVLPTITTTTTSRHQKRLRERRLHVIKLLLTNEASDNQMVMLNRHVDFHISMKLDWRMIGQMFIIDGVLYGIKDRHLYSSKLQFAYDLYKCKLLSSEYLNEPHRTFTNHFGNTQMIKYNPNEPKRLYTIDNGNLLWCPVKLVPTSFEELWQQQQQANQTTISND